MSELLANPKCSACKCYFVPTPNPRSNMLYKSCEKCRIRIREIQNNNKCEHNRLRRYCKDCGGSQICEHNRQRSRCKDCGGSQICEHNRHRNTCKDCGGSSICEHNRMRNTCKDCGGASICEHNRVRSTCKECSGSQICEHNRIRSKCKECGGSQICEHRRRRHDCKECSGSQICEHNKHKHSCKDCSPILCLINLQRRSIARIMKQTNIAKTKPSIEYLGCSAEYFKQYIQSKMTAEMNFDNIHYDHIKPVSKFNLEDEEELLKCCHYTNFQPLLSTDNLEKSNKWNDECERFWNENICGIEYTPIYNPF